MSVRGIPALLATITVSATRPLSIIIIITLFCQSLQQNKKHRQFTWQVARKTNVQITSDSVVNGSIWNVYTDAVVVSCDTTEFGCCSDGHTIAPGPNGTGCPGKICED